MSSVVRIAALLHEYTEGRDEVSVEGATLGEVMDELDQRYPGLAFRVIDEQGRVRKHMKVFAGEVALQERSSPVRKGAQLFIVGALSGG